MGYRLFRYEVKCVNDCSGEELVHKGILVATSYENAVHILCSDNGYGSEIIYVKVTDLMECVISDSDLALCQEMY